MIAINRNSELKSQANDAVKIKIIGIGGAGSNVLDRMALDGIENARLVAMNTDVQSLASSVAPEKIQFGRETTRGLGAGGDPELGYAAAGEAVSEIRRLLEGAGMVFICAGLGGGTGSGAAPLVAALAREQGALVVAFATMPFTFEGRRRRQQAVEALASLQASADAVICFENDRMGDAVAPKAGVHQAFANADQIVSQSVKAISGLFSRPGIIRIGFDDLVAALRNNDSRCLFGYGESDGDNRVHDALARALKNPLMDRGRMLTDAQNVLVNIAGGPGLTLNEVQILMDELGKHISDCSQILFGTAVDSKMGNRLSVTILSSIGDGQAVPELTPVSRKRAATIPPAAEQAAPEPEASAQAEEFFEEVAPGPEAVFPEEVAAELVPEPAFESAAEPEATVASTESSQETLLEMSEPEPEAQPARPEPTPSRSRRHVFPVPPPRIAPQPLPRSGAKPAPAAVPAPAPVAAKKPAEPRQETLQFEPVTRGRFEKSEPTIVDGQDLDVPTFLRRNVRVK